MRALHVLPFVLLLVSTFTAAAPAAAPAAAQARTDKQVRGDHRMRTITLLQKEDFVTLDRTLQALRTNRTRTPSGIWAYPDALGGAFQHLSGLKAAAKSATPALLLLDKWSRINPKSTVVPILRAQLYLDIAFDFRGEEYAHLVKEAAWKPFFANVATARQILEKSKPFASVDPGWYVVMTDVATLEGWPSEKFSELLREGVAREPTYHFTYFEAVRYLSPKWGGSVKSLEEFASWAEKAAGKVEGPAMYARIFWYAMETGAVAPAAVTFKGLSWPKMRAGFDAMMSRYPDDWNLQNYAKFACLAGDQKKTKELMLKITHPMPSAWVGEGRVIFSDCRYDVAKIRDDVQEGRE